MFDLSDITESIPVWFETSLIPGTTSTDKPPDLRVHLVRDEGDTLAVEVAEGHARSNETVFVPGRGAYEVTATLTRSTVGGERVYLRLRPARSWRSRAA